MFLITLYTMPSPVLGFCVLTFNNIFQLFFTGVNYTVSSFEGTTDYMYLKKESSGKYLDL